MKSVINKYNVLTLLLLFFFIIIPFYSVNASDGFGTDGNGEYHINSIEDWKAFLDQMDAGEDFSGTLVNLDTDLELTGLEYEFNLFAGTFNGNGHTLTYINHDIGDFNSVFPLDLYSGTLKNISIYLKDCQIDVSKHNGRVNTSVLALGGYKNCVVENVNLYGEITILLDPTRSNDVECSGIPLGRSSIKNCVVNISYNLSEENTNKFLENTDELQLKIKMYQFGYSSSWGMSVSNSYAIGQYNSIFDKYADMFDKYYQKSNNMDDEYIIIAPFGGRTDSIDVPSFENCYSNNEIAPFYLHGDEKAKNYATSFYTFDDSMAKSTTDLKKKETFVDYDFETTWGISEYINDGYPYLQALVSKDLIDMVNQINALPKEDEITKDNKEAVEKLKEALAGLSEKEKALISFEALTEKVTKAEKAIKAIEDKEKQEGGTEPATSTVVSVKKGTKFTVKGYKYTVTGTDVKNPTVTVIGYKNKKLKKVSVPDTVAYQKIAFKVTAVGNNAFKGQKKATVAVLGKNVGSIGKAAFAGDLKVKKITIKSAVLKKVGVKAFKGIHKKAVIKVPKNQLKAYKKLLKNKGQAKTAKIK